MYTPVLHGQMNNSKADIQVGLTNIITGVTYGNSANSVLSCKRVKQLTMSHTFSARTSW